jgi:peptide/nickel transport system ATP-binding protein
MYAGRIVERGRTDDVFASPLHPYTWGLMASIPPLTGTRLEKLRSIPGMPPTPDTIGEGCGFAPRCDFARAVCTERPPLRRAGDQTALCVLDDAERPALRQAALPIKEMA